MIIYTKEVDNIYDNKFSSGRKGWIRLEKTKKK